MVAVVVVDCSLVEDKASMTGLVGADCSQAEGSLYVQSDEEVQRQRQVLSLGRLLGRNETYRAGGMVAVVRQAVVAGSTTCLVIY